MAQLSQVLNASEYFLSLLPPNTEQIQLLKQLNQTVGELEDALVQLGVIANSNTHHKNTRLFIDQQLMDSYFVPWLAWFEKAKQTHASSSDPNLRKLLKTIQNDYEYLILCKMFTEFADVEKQLDIVVLV